MYAKKRFGQNFLHDKNCLHKIIAALKLHARDHVVEIGPGLGSLTQELLRHLPTLDAIEIDRDLIPQLQKLPNLRVHHADALHFDFASLSAPQQIRVVGNLPYNIATPLLFYLLQFYASIKDLHFMLQREVAERIAALPGSKIYGRLSVMMQYYFVPKILFIVKPGAFTPRPEVDSAFVRLVPDARKLPARNPQHFAQVVQMAFNQRRKTIKNSLAALITSETLITLGLCSTARPEELTVDDFVKIADATSPVI